MPQIPPPSADDLPMICDDLRFLENTKGAFGAQAQLFRFPGPKAPGKFLRPLEWAKFWAKIPTGSSGWAGGQAGPGPRSARVGKKKPDP